MVEMECRNVRYEKSVEIGMIRVRGNVVRVMGEMKVSVVVVKVV